MYKNLIFNIFPVRTKYFRKASFTLPHLSQQTFYRNQEKMNTVEKACNYPRIYHAMETKKICLAHSLDGGTKAVSSFSKVGFHHSKSPITVRNLVLLFLQHLRITIGMKTLLNHQKAYSNFSLIDRIRTNHKTECRNKKGRTYVWS